MNVNWISQSCAKQRAGRAGRLCAGECYRLYTREHHCHMASHDVPEILRMPLQVNIDFMQFNTKKKHFPKIIRLFKSFIVLLYFKEHLYIIVIFNIFEKLNYVSVEYYFFLQNKTIL